MGSEKWNFRMTPVRVTLILLLVMGVAMCIFRMATGLGYSTNLTDAWPWGLWIIVDLTAVALAGAGYSMAVLAHILHVKDFMPLARRGLLISLCGYIFVLLTLLMEIGRWDNAYRPLISWGASSPLFEVFVAISIYMIIQTLEFGEVVTEKVFKPLNKVIAVTLPVVFFLGALIPFGHQASLGAVYLAMPTKLDPLWFSSMMPWFFLITSFYVGPAMIMLDALWSSKAYKHKLDMGPLKKLARVAGSLMAIYFVWKVIDLSRLGHLQNAFAGGFQGNMFLIEMLIGVLVPAIICFTPWISTRAGMLSFSLLAIFGIAMNRFNVVYTGMVDSLGATYVPNVVEWGITIGLVALVALIYLFVVENFKIYEYSEQEAVEEQTRTSTAKEIPAYSSK
ncbi:Ni/Fe-hydrogenase subunit HybB-like protein [Desulfitispora alkaliphila]|uniref:NrfD/PsrC family molybdoenzyme membrane anchor subunit n=1 Tax=Desulfitispora alkaliphila TaxID=622674 RepID=UPI003D24D9AD